MSARHIILFAVLLSSLTVRAEIAGTLKVSASDGYPPIGMDRVVLKSGQSFSKQVNRANTLYIIQDNFELDKNVTLPYNIILQFEGGGIKNTGGYLLTGQNTIINAGLEQIFSVDVKLKGTWAIDQFDIRWFGVKSGDKKIDCTKVINNIESCNIPFYFPHGTYYLSELYYQNKKGDSFTIMGEEPFGLGAKVNFMPFDNHQRYIIKIGGGHETLGGSGRGYDIKIMNINFTTPQGYEPSNLNNSYTNTKGEYLNGGLILDVVEIGQFAISGCEIHNMPFLTLGYIYECEFDYIICYGNHGKSIQPAIQIVNSQSKPYSALHVKKMMGEVIVGPMIKTVGRCSGTELVIDNFYFEGTVNWERESISSENRYSEIINLADFEIVPIFDLEGCGFTIVDAELNSTNTKWRNKLDGSGKQCVRGLFNFNNTLCGANILNLENNGGSNWMYITGSAMKSYPINVSIGETNCFFQTDTRNINLIVEDKRIIDDGRTIPIKSNTLYADGSLNDITVPFFIKNRGTSGYIQQLKNERKGVTTLYNSYMFNEYGFGVDTNVTCLYFEYYINREGNCDIVIEYYDASKTLVSSESKWILADKKISQQVVTLNPPAKATVFKIKYGANNGCDIFVYKFGVFDSEHVPVKRVGNVRPEKSLLTPGFKFFDTTLGKPIYWTGDATKGDNGWVDANGNHP